MVPKLPPLYSQKTFSRSLANAIFENVVFLCSTFISHLNWNAQPPNNQTSEQWKNYLTFEGFFTYLIIWQIFSFFTRLLFLSKFVHLFANLFSRLYRENWFAFNYILYSKAALNRWLVSRNNWGFGEPFGLGKWR